MPELEPDHKILLCRGCGKISKAVPAYTRSFLCADCWQNYKPGGSMSRSADTTLTQNIPPDTGTTTETGGEDMAKTETVVNAKSKPKAKKEPKPGKETVGSLLSEIILGGETDKSKISQKVLSKFPDYDPKKLGIYIDARRSYLKSKGLLK